ncbi:MAG: sortase [Sporichthyaceae bacterium]
MTSTAPPPAPPAPAPSRGPRAPIGPSARLRDWLEGTQRRPKSTDERAVLIATSMSILAALLFGFLAQVSVLGTLKHNRDQQIAYDDLRLTLAEGTAPVGPAAGRPIAKGAPIARISIASVGIKEVVLAGTTAEVLRSGIGHRRDTVLPGQSGLSVLMGRRMAYGGPFSQLGFLVRGDEVRIVTGQGEAVYAVVGIRLAGDPQSAPHPARLTLITTAGPRFAPSDALRVDADLVSAPFPTATPAFTARNLPADERAMASEPDALADVGAWGILLVAAAIAVTWLRLIWGRWQAWLVGVPILGWLGTAVSDNAARLLPNLL